MTKVRFLTGAPLITCVAEQRLQPEGLRELLAWVKDHRPECLPADAEHLSWTDLFPHDLTEGDRPLSHNELLVELAGRKCYDSFCEKAGRRTNGQYIDNTQGGRIPHRSILYHAKMTFFIAGVSRRVSQELMRNYVGADRDQEGNPSQESTRFTHHYGTYVAHPRLLEPGQEDELRIWKQDIERQHGAYEAYILRQFDHHRDRTRAEGGQALEPKGMVRKRIYESAIGRLPWEFETSFIWTTNPVAIAKFLFERGDDASDLEMQRFARTWQAVCLDRWPNLFSPGRQNAVAAAE